jgi:nicotinamidase-related amidase
MAGLTPPPHTSRRVAVLVIDVISDFEFPGGAKLLTALQAKSFALRKLLARARSHRVPVIYVNDNQGPWKSDFPALRARASAQSPAIRRLVEELTPAPSDYVVLKPRHSAFYGTPVEALLEHLRISNLILAGTTAENCVWITSCDAHTRGFKLIVPEDTMAGMSRTAFTATLTGLREVLQARTPEHAASVRFDAGRLG